MDDRRRRCDRCSLAGRRSRSLVVLAVLRLRNRPAVAEAKTFEQPFFVAFG